jgi:DNA-binding NtrC family response regulator
MPTVRERAFAGDGAGTSALGTSAAMQRVLARMIQAAGNGRHVLIGGEAGTDYEGAAREIHRRGSSSRGPFVKVVYTSNSPEALELDLFGYHTAGRSTQGQERRSLERIAKGGLLHQALGGIIFFEQLTEFPARVQAKLARVFRDGEVVVISERTPVTLDVRAIAAVGDDYDRALQEGRVRDDLHRVFSRARIDIPPLRERREDIPLLARQLLASICADSGLPSKGLSEAAEHVLAALPWERNVEELRELLSNLVFRASGPIVEIDEVLRLVTLGGPARPTPLGGTLREAREGFERDYISAVLRQHGGSVPDAARMLGIQRTNLYRKMRKLKVGQQGTKKS